ncbi:hypothetical protein BCY88_08815 [Paraburkholderia fungorum]|uniref:Uncharacterized protein n=1 Tax=Paraburkholderia fungorum TaxID=134537 RepID=A0A420FRX2_9BURK|nr:hypothetical protein BCY88_08815 [Paraburkholderia fungorum]
MSGIARQLSPGTTDVNRERSNAKNLEEDAGRGNSGKQSRFGPGRQARPDRQFRDRGVAPDQRYPGERRGRGLLGMVGLGRIVAMCVADRGSMVIALIAMAIGDHGRCRRTYRRRMLRCGAGVRRHPQLAEEQRNE